MADRPGKRPRSLASRRSARYAGPGLVERARALAAAPGMLQSFFVGSLLFLLCAAVIGLSQGRLMLAEGRILDLSRTARIDFEVLDAANTERERALQGLFVPRIYAADESAVRELEASIRSLPSAAAAAESFDGVAPEIREAFGLTPERFEALRLVGTVESEVGIWTARTARLIESFVEHPLLSREELQLLLSDPSPRLEARLPSGAARTLVESSAISPGDDSLPIFRTIVASAGFEGLAAECIVQRLRSQTRPLFGFDKNETDRIRERAMQSVSPVMARYRAGELLARRGEKLQPEQFALLRAEHEQFQRSLPTEVLASRWIGVLGVALAITAAFLVYVRLFYSELASTPGKFFGLSLLMAGGAGLACWATASQPGWMWATAVAPVVFTTMLSVVAFEPRLGLAMAAAQCAVVGAALSLPLGYVALILSAAGLAAWRLRDIRNRNDVVRAALITSVGLALSTCAIGLLERPLVAQGPALWNEIARDSLLAALAGFIAGSMTLVFLPTAERIFGVTTGMTLSEWRDPKQPLLKQLQLRAPGTFNHSHTVATLAEAAAESIGANGLHVYVGALYHDIGKMNKPDYFVENQPRGFNKHTKLSPAMSLLVIVGHVKDGAELAREYRLPASLHGYIETHHGTTLVEYFYDQARRQAEGDDDEPMPSEIEYRYPGPKPRTREQAILMLCDAVESATRSMPDPTPARIQSLVHQLATRRLMDGQFDESSLTLSELRRIEEAVSRTLASIYHGRIAYPSADTADKRQPEPERKTGVAEQAG